VSESTQLVNINTQTHTRARVVTEASQRVNFHNFGVELT